MSYGFPTSVCISWLCKRQTCVTLSSAEAESVALTMALRRMAMPSRLQGLLPESTMTVVECDAEAVVKLMGSGGVSRALEHLRHTAGINTAWAAEVLNSPEFTLKQVPTGEQLADAFTKGLSRPAFEIARVRLGVGTRFDEDHYNQYSETAYLTVGLNRRARRRLLRALKTKRSCGAPGGHAGE